jgi:hypothetical protein
MSVLLFDTLRLSRTLRDKGQFTSQQVEALVEALGEAAQGDLATKAEIERAKGELKAEIERAKGELKAEIERVRTEIATIKVDLLKWIVVGALGIQTIVIVGAVVTLIKASTK